MRGLFVLCFLLLLPVLAVLGHDIYATYQDGDYTRTLMFSNLRYIAINYTPDLYVWVERNADPDLWENHLIPLFDMKTIVIAAIPAIIIVPLFLVLRLLKLPHFTTRTKIGRRQKKSDFSFGSGEKNKGRMTYKRK